jgi:hypothetical protein
MRRRGTRVGAQRLNIMAVPFDSRNVTPTDFLMDKKL